MNNIIVKSSKIVNADIALVLLSGICSIRIFSGVMTFVSFAGLVISFLVGIIVYGRIVARVRGVEHPPGKVIIRENLFNYLLVVILLALPVLLFSQLAKMAAVSPKSYILAKDGVNALIHIATIYALPIVFIKRQNIIAIFAGISYFFQNLKSSLGIIALVVVMFALNAAIMFWSIIVFSPQASMLGFVPLMLLVNVIFAYLDFMIFAAATTVLIAPRNEVVECEA